MKVFVAKHFFERKYDYRAEWLRLIQTLTATDDNLPLKKRAIKALAQIVGSSAGRLWLRSEDKSTYSAVVGWDTQPISSSLSATSPLPVFLCTNGWIVDIVELLEKPHKYAPVSKSDLPFGIVTAGFVVPLLHERELIGFVTLAIPGTSVTLNFEDHDLLKTAGQQIASYLVQEDATDQLAESRQFEAYNRFTAFVMHDLKNAIAQQSLVVENAERHKRNPEFVDDAIETIKGSVQRMRRVMRHLRQDAIFATTERVDISKLVLRAESLCADREPIPVASVPQRSFIVKANHDRLLSGLSHAIRNAQDACDRNGTVSLELREDDGRCCIDISDDGAGMDADFVRDRLFRPFDSTKGSEGMGIGAYQIRETVRACGGDVLVQSDVGAGTTMTLCLPLVTGEAE